MKRYVPIIAATFLALVSCSREADTSHTAEYFEQGETVVLAVKADDTATRVSSELDSKNIVFKWQSGDKILVTVGGSTAQFTLTGGAGTESAIFEGKMPAAGSTFNVQYPCQTPELGEQTYSSTEPLPHDKMLFTATNCSTTDAVVSLQCQYAALRLNLYGTSQTIGKIVVTNTTSGTSSYTLDCGDGVTIGSTEAAATSFFIVVRAEESDWNFSAKIFDNATTPASICSFKTTAAKTFTAGKVLNMPAKEVKEASTVLLSGIFSVSATKKVNFTKGNLYYSTTDSKYHIEAQQNVTSATLRQSSYDATHVCHFFWSNITDWETTGKEPWAQSYDYSAQSTSDKFFCGIDNPMTVDGQSGLYALTGGDTGEWKYLLDTRKVTIGGESKTSYGEGTVNDVKGLIILPDNWDGSVCSGFTYGTSSYSNKFTESTTTKWSDMEKAGCVFLPAAGLWDYYNLGQYEVGRLGDYWSSSPHSSDAGSAYRLYFYSDKVSPAYNYNRNTGFSVRLVSTAQ